VKQLKIFSLFIIYMVFSFFFLACTSKYYRNGMHAYDTGNYELALENFKKLYGEDDSYPDLKYKIEASEYGLVMKKYEKTGNIKHLKNFLKKYPNSQRFSARIKKIIIEKERQLSKEIEKREYEQVKNKAEEAITSAKSALINQKYSNSIIKSIDLAINSIQKHIDKYPNSDERENYLDDLNQELSILRNKLNRKLNPFE